MNCCVILSHARDLTLNSQSGDERATKTPYLRVRWSFAASIIVCTTIWSCAATKPSSPPHRRLSFDSMFVGTRTTVLRGDTASPLRQVNAGRVLSHAIVLSDPDAGDVKLFDLTDGTFRRVVGAPGDGPGEFRHVVAIAAAGVGQFAVLDQKRRTVSFRDTEGHLLREIALHGGAFHSLVVLPDEQRMIISGAIWEKGPAKGFDLHEYDFAGHPLASFATTAPTRSKWEAAFAATYVDKAGETLLQGSVSANRLRLIDRRTGELREIAVAPGWYHQLSWPPDAAFGPGYSQQTASEIGTAWMHRQVMMNGVYALPDGMMLTRFQAFAPDGDRFYYYATVDTSGRTLAISTPTRAMVFDTHADTIYWMHAKRGDFRVSHGVFRKGLFGS